MNEEQNYLIQSEPLSVSEAITGVITSPAETFQTIAETPPRNYWLVPIIISIVLGLAATFIFMSDAELVQNTMDKQKEKLREQFDKNVQEGKMTREDADKALEGITSESSFFKVAGYGGAVLGPFIILFLLSVVYLIILKIMKAEFGFSNVLNVVGLSFIVASIGSLVAMVIAVFTGTISGVGLGLFFSEEAVGTKAFSIISKIDVFQIWFYALIATGLSKVAKIGMPAALAAVFGVYIVYAIASSFLV